jgi:hypothetical protein
MRRAFMLFLFALAGLAVVVQPTSAATLTDHSDPDDTRSRPDIRKVWTDRGDGVSCRSRRGTISPIATP